MRCFTLVLLLLLGAARTWSQNDIQFRVDMRDALDHEFFLPGEGDRVILRGSFCDWLGERFVLTDDDSDGTYVGLFKLPGDDGTDIEYKFLIVRPDGRVFWEFRPEPGNPPFGNRRLTLTGSPLVPEAGEFVYDPYDLAAVGMPVLFSVEELRTDLHELRDTLEQKHCCLYEYTNKERMDSLFERQAALLDRPMPPHEFYRVLAPIAAAIGCGHTSLWMPGEFWTHAGDALFPLRIRLMDGYPVVTGYYGKAGSVPVGSILTRINGREAREIVDELAALYTADWYNRNFRLMQVQRRFPMLYARAWGFASAYDIDYALPGRKTSAAVTVEGADIDAVRASVFPPAELSFRIDEETRTGVLRISSFIYYDREDMFRAYMDSCFAVLSAGGVERLVVDLRGNDGGDPFCAAALLSHIEHEPVRYFAEPYGRYAELAEPVPLAAAVFRGRLAVLIDGSNFSTAAHLCALLRQHGIGVLIGEETGGTFTCNAATKELRLHNTRLRSLIPTATFSSAVTTLDRRRGVLPDRPARQRYRDFLAGRDTVMEYALQFLQEEH